MTLDERHAHLLSQVDDYVAAQPNPGTVPLDGLEPSLFVIAVRPRAGSSNSTVRIVGNPQHLAKVLARLLADPTAGEFMAVLADEMELLDRALDNFSEN